MTIDITDFRYLSAVADMANFTRAARSLGVNPATISRRVARLEDELGVTIFERRHFGVRLTGAGRAVMVHVRRTLDDFAAVVSVSGSSGNGTAGQIRLGVRIPPVGEPLRGLLATWHERHPDVILNISEINDSEALGALKERRLDAALLFGHSLWPDATSATIFQERLFAGLPEHHTLSSYEGLSWSMLRGEMFLTQEWEGSHSAREMYVSLLGGGIDIQSHSASKQSVLGLVAAGFGVTLALESQSQISVPGVVFRPIFETNAVVDIELAWCPHSEEAVVGRFLAFMREEAKSRRDTIAKC